MNLKIEIKKIMPEFILQALKNRREYRSKLFLDDEFIEYVYSKKEGLIKNGHKIELITLRGSHADYSTYSNDYDNVYNLGLTSTDLYTTFELYENTKSLMPRLKYVVVFYSVFTPGLCLVKTKERNRLITYSHFFNFDYQCNNLIDKYDEKLVLNRIKRKKFKKINSEFRGYVNPSHFSVDMKASHRVKTHLRENKRVPNQLGYLEKLSDSVNKDGRKLIILLSPNRQDYKDELKNENGLFDSLRNIKIKNCQVIDYYNSELLNDCDFGDTDHLNIHGAKKLTKDLLSRLDMI